MERLDDQIWPLIYWNLELMPLPDLPNGVKKSEPAADKVAAQTVQPEPEAS